MWIYSIAFSTVQVTHIASKNCQLTFELVVLTSLKKIRNEPPHDKTNI